MIKLLFAVLLVLMPLVSASAIERKLTEAQIKKEFFEDCLASSNNKYELYRKCIGKFTDACIENPDKYESVMKSISVGPSARNCTEQESIWWAEFFKKNAKELEKNVHFYLKDERIKSALEETIVLFSEENFKRCHYETVRWGFRDGGNLVNIAGLDFGFRCHRDTNAEKAIKAYLWNKHLKVMENIQ